ncbi:hypothetical protein KSS87_018431 [Heliosperma pusillum]|nr:hypothetical protein KSS87_018431 [Heliosperma pusillum]
MSIRLNSPFIGTPNCSSSSSSSSFFDGRKGSCHNVVYVGKRWNSGRRGFSSCRCWKRSNWPPNGVWFPQFYGRIVKFLNGNGDPDSRNGLRVNYVKERLSRGKELVRSLSPLWQEGLLLFRGAIFGAVISGVCLLVWYGRAKSKEFVELKVLPSVCSVLSEYIQREVDFGKVRRISPLSITLESCSVGPHSEEFSCGEAPTIKVRVRPFASLRRGKIVIDAVLSNPTLLVAQKKDFTWLGIPYMEGGLQNHESTEEGIDYRTRTRRAAREEAGASWARERDDVARKAAETGYVVRDHGSTDVHGEASSNSSLTVGKSLVDVDEGTHWKHHHLMDTGIQYDVKHTDLEKSFGVYVPSSRIKSLPQIILGPVFPKFKRKANGKDLSVSSVATKKRVLERSAFAAVQYFQHPGHGDIAQSLDSDEGFEIADAEESMVDSEALTNALTTLPNAHTSNVSEVVDSKSVEMIDDGMPEASYSHSSTTMDQRITSKTKPCLSQSSEPPASDTDIISEALPCTGKVDAKVQEDTTDMNRLKGVVDEQWRSEDQNAESFTGMPEDQGGSHSESPLSLNSRPISAISSKNDHKFEDIVTEVVEEADNMETGRNDKTLPVTLDSVYFKGGTLMLLAYGDAEPRFQSDLYHNKILLTYLQIREMRNVDGHIKLLNHYSRVHVQLSGNCQMWRSDTTVDDGGVLSTDVFVDIIEQKWHANLKFANLYVPLFERLLDIPIAWTEGRASGEGERAPVMMVWMLPALASVESGGEGCKWGRQRGGRVTMDRLVHICMSSGENFPNLHGQLDVTGVSFQILDAPSSFSDISASLCFRGQRIFLHNANGWFGSVPLEASGDFGIHPEEGEFHLMCQVPCVEVNALMRTFKMKPLLFPVAGCVTAIFNCQGPLDTPVFVGSGMVTRKTGPSISDVNVSSASEALASNKDAGAVAAFDRIPFSYLSANFTFNSDNCVADLYGIRASLVDGGEIRGAGNAWICLEAEVDESAMDVNFSGSLPFDKILHRYVPGCLDLLPMKLGELKGETKLSGCLLRPYDSNFYLSVIERFDVKWNAPKAEGSFIDARGDVIICHDYIAVNSSSIAFDLFAKVLTCYPEENWINKEDHDIKSENSFTMEGLELDLRMRGFEFFNMISSFSFDSPRPLNLKATGRIKFQGQVTNQQSAGDGNMESLEGDVSVSGLKLNQLMLAPQLAGHMGFSRERIKLDATGRPDESLNVDIIGLLRPTNEESQDGKFLSVSLQKGQLKANVFYQPAVSVNLEAFPVRHLPLDELELASLRGTMQRAEVQLNLQKRRGLGVLSVLRPKFSGVLGEALDVAVRWSGDVITVEKTVLEQSYSRYELQGEYVLPGTRDRKSSPNESGSFFSKAMAGHLGSVISSMGRWRVRLEVPQAEAAEMLPLARLLSRSTDPAVHSRSKDLFMQSLQSVGISAESLQELLEPNIDNSFPFFEAVRRDHTPSDEVIPEDLSLPGLSELKGRWHGSLDASGGGNGDTVAEFDFHGDDWEWGAYKTQRVQAIGAYSNDDGLRLEKIFIQKDNATIHADGTLLGPKTNLHFAVLNFPVSLVPMLVQVIESSTTDAIRSLRQLLAPVKGILHMEGDLRGNLLKPECDVQVRLLDGAIGGIDLGRAEVVASVTSGSRFLFNAKFEPIVQNGHVHVQGSVPVTFVPNNDLNKEDTDTSGGKSIWSPGWTKSRGREPVDGDSEKKVPRERNEDGWDVQLAESLKGLNWNLLDVGEVRVDADIKDGGMMLLTALCPYADWLHGNAEIMLQVRGTVERPELDGSATFHRASVSSPVLRKPLTNLGGRVLVKSNRLCISSLESRVSRRGKLLLKGNLPLTSAEASLDDKIDVKCEVLEVRAKNVLSGQVDSQLQITGSILEPSISGKIKLCHGEAHLPHDKGSGAAPFNRLPSTQTRLPKDSYSRVVAARYVSRFFGSEPATSNSSFLQFSGNQAEIGKQSEQVSKTPKVDVQLNNLKLLLGPELRIVYPLILNFAVSGELDLNGVAHPKLIKPKGVLTFENGDVNLVATQIRLKREHVNSAKFEPDNGLDPTLDLALVGSEWQFRVQGRASNWHEKLVVTSTRSVEQDVLSPTEAARVFESQLAESILEGDGQLALKKLATSTLESLMPRIEGKGEFGQARWRLVYAPQIPSLLSVDPTVDPLKSLASNISFGTEVEVQLGKRLQASIVRQMKDSEMAMQWTLIYKLTSRLRLLLQSAPSQRLLFEYSTTSQD